MSARAATQYCPRVYDPDSDAAGVVDPANELTFFERARATAACVSLSDFSPARWPDKLRRVDAPAPGSA